MEVLHVINVKKSRDRYQKMIDVWSSFFTLQRFEAVVMKDTFEACKQSHLQLLSQLKTVDQPFHLVAEDDVYPTSYFTDLWPSILEYITNHDDWDIISLDPNLHQDFCNLRFFRHESFFQVDKFRNAGFVIYRHQFLVSLDLNYYRRCFGSLDMTLFHDSRFHKLTPRKLTVKQYDGRSVRTGQPTNHQWDLTEQELVKESQHLRKTMGLVVSLASNITRLWVYALVIIFLIVIISFLVWWNGDEKYDFNFLDPVQKGTLL